MACINVFGAASFVYRSKTTVTQAMDSIGAELVLALSIKQCPITGQVILGDYNDRSPNAPMYPMADVTSPAAFGYQYEYGDHFKDDDTGKTLAAIRSEEIACRKRQFYGASDARGFRAGGIFTLVEHYRGDVNIDHLITEVTYQGAQDFAAGDDDVHLITLECLIAGAQGHWPTMPILTSIQSSAHGNFVYRMTAHACGSRAATVVSPKPSPSSAV